MQQQKHAKRGIIILFIVFIISTNHIHAQDDFGKGLGIQLALPVQNATFSGEDFGEVKMGRQGFYFQLSRQTYLRQNNLGFHSYKTIGLALRSNNINIKEGNKLKQKYKLQIPIIIITALVLVIIILNWLLHGK